MPPIAPSRKKGKKHDKSHKSHSHKRYKKNTKTTLLNLMIFMLKRKMFHKAWYRPSKSAGIGYIHIFIKVVPALLKTPEQGLKATGPILALLKSAGTGLHDPIPTFKKRRSKAPGKKTPG